MLTAQQAWSSIVAHVRPLPTVVVDLADAAGYVLAGSVSADRDLPPHDRSAMDGFAVRAEDLPSSSGLRVIGEVAAGSPERPEVVRGTCARIFTGANVPPGADTVVPVENASEPEPGHVRFEAKVRAGANILRQGENAGAGEVILVAGQPLSSMGLAACASVGLARVQVAGKPRIVVITTGRELLPPEATAGAHQERDSNQAMIRSALTEAGFVEVTCQRVPDDRDAIEATLRRALDGAHAVVFSGGVSVGAYDFVPAAVASIGARVLVHGVAIRPGKPFLFALAPGGLAIFGLPGNPLSAATALHEFVLPALRRMSGLDEHGCRPLVRARLCEPVTNTPGRQRYLLATLRWGQGGPEVVPVASQSSADLVAGARADGVIVVPADARGLDAGAAVDFRPWRRWP